MKIIRPLLQEIYRDNPWQMLVCCILLNLTHRRQVDTVREELFSKWPTPEKMMHANETELAELLKPLGFYNKRARTLIKMSKQWVTNDPTWIHVGDLPGIGEYAMDSWEIFQMENIPKNPDVVQDKVLKQYIKEYWDGNSDSFN
tara:strand:+ start:1582 stop:2013 length:432 start_codon:yes stop_codon:yes gene_type:complete